MNKQIVSTPKAPGAIGPYSQAVKTGLVVFTSGQIGLSPATGELVSQDFEAQVRQSFANLAAVAEAAGGSLANAVKFTLFLTDLSKFGKVNEIMTEKQWNPAKYHSGGKINGWQEFVKLGLWQSDQYPFKKKWEKGFKTETKKFEFYSETLKKVLGAHAEKHKVTIDEVMEVTQYAGRGEQPPRVYERAPPLRASRRNNMKNIGKKVRYIGPQVCVCGRRASCQDTHSNIAGDKRRTYICLRGKSWNTIERRVAGKRSGSGVVVSTKFDAQQSKAVRLRLEKRIAQFLVEELI